jgi:hypothetical protein
MGSGFMSVGDLVVVPLGCRTPIIIRPDASGQGFRFVGDVYVDRYMTSLAIKYWKDGYRGLETFVLH